VHLAPRRTSSFRRQGRFFSGHAVTQAEQPVTRRGRRPFPNRARWTALATAFGSSGASRGATPADSNEVREGCLLDDRPPFHRMMGLRARAGRTGPCGHLPRRSGSIGVCRRSSGRADRRSLRHPRRTSHMRPSVPHSERDRVRRTDRAAHARGPRHGLALFDGHDVAALDAERDATLGAIAA